MKTRCVRFCLILSVFCGLALALPCCTTQEKGLQSAPDFSLKSIDGQEITLSRLRGKIVFVDFWATWCGPCRESIPHLAQLHRDYSNKGLEIIGVSVDKGGTEPVRRFVKSLDIPYPVAIASGDLDKRYGVSALPTGFLIDQNGMIREKFVGFSAKMAEELDAKISALTAPKPQEKT